MVVFPLSIEMFLATSPGTLYFIYSSLFSFPFRMFFNSSVKSINKTRYSIKYHSVLVQNPLFHIKLTFNPPFVNTLFYSQLFGCVVFNWSSVWAQLFVNWILCEFSCCFYRVLCELAHCLFVVRCVRLLVECCRSTLARSLLSLKCKTHPQSYIFWWRTGVFATWIYLLTY